MCSTSLAAPVHPLGTSAWGRQSPNVLRASNFAFGRITRVQRSPREPWVDGAPNGISVPRWSLSKPHLKGAVHGQVYSEMSSVTRLGLDLAKKIFQGHAVDANGEIVVVRKLARGRLVGFFSELPRCVVAIEACSSAHHWGGNCGRSASK